MRCQQSALSCQLENDRRGRPRSELLDAIHEFIVELSIDPTTAFDLAPSGEVPRQLEQPLFATRQLDDVDQVVLPHNDRSRHVAEAAPRPSPPRPRLISFDRRVLERLRFPVEPRGVMRQRGAIPEQLARDVGAGTEVRQPVHPVPV
jgi:hypothetical protein